jgi:hypothetical protein
MLLTLFGAAQGAVVVTPPPQVVVIQGGGGDWRDFVEEKARAQNKREIRTQERQLKKVEKKIANAYQRLPVQKNTEGILANLHRLETKRTEIIARIQELKIEFTPPSFDDEEDVEILLLDS